MDISYFAYFAPLPEVISLFSLFSQSVKEKKMQQLPSQQALDTLRKKRNNSSGTLNKDKRRKGSGYTECEKSEKSEISISYPDTLMETYQTVLRRVRYCHRYRHDDDRYRKGHARLTRILAREYLPALNALRETYPSEALEAERDNLLDRLERGWQMADSDRVARTFVKLLTRYEVLCDALDGDVMARHLSRVERVAA